MGYVLRAISTVGGRSVIMAFGVAYIAVGAVLPLSPAFTSLAVSGLLIDSILLLGSGLTLAYGGYHLSRTNVHPDLSYVVARWCLRAFGVMLAIVSLSALAGGVDDPISGFIVLPVLASVAGLGMGYHDAQAKTRALVAEERQREAEEYSRELERYKTIVETVNDGIYITNEDNVFTLVNDAYCELVGYDREELIGSSSSLVLAEGTDVEALAEEVQQDITEEVTKAYETMLETASGETIEVEWTFSPLSEPEDAIPDTVGVVRDVTERNERERQLERQNERLDNFASMLAHELRNPVTMGQIYSQQLPADENQEAVEYVSEAFDRIENTVDVMLVVARGRDAISESTSVQFTEAVQEAWAEIDAPDATLEVMIDQTIETDGTYIRHLFRNLFENAIEHGGTEVTVTVGELPTGFYVADDGRGIPADAREQVFETGYTSAASEGGMGLGLTFVQGMAEVYGWECSVTESDAGGAQFQFENVTKTHSVTE